MLAFFSISPMGTGESVSGAVAETVAMIADSGLDYKLTAMGTIIEGEPNEVFDLIKRCHAQMRRSYNRVTSKVFIDDRGGEMGRIRSKIQSIEEKIGKS